MLENHYLYKVKQTLFNKGKEETFDISCTVIIRCEAGKILFTTKNYNRDIVAWITRLEDLYNQKSKLLYSYMHQMRA